MAAHYRFAVSETVRVLPASPLKRFRQGRRGKKRVGEEGQVVFAEQGQHSQRPLYTISFAGQLDSFFEDELEAVAETDIVEAASAPPYVRPGARSRPSALSERRAA